MFEQNTLSSIEQLIGSYLPYPPKNRFELIYHSILNKLGSFPLNRRILHNVHLTFLTYDDEAIHNQIHESHLLRHIFGDKYILNLLREEENARDDRVYGRKIIRRGYSIRVPTPYRISKK